LTRKLGKLAASIHNLGNPVNSWYGYWDSVVFASRVTHVLDGKMNLPKFDDAPRQRFVRLRKFVPKLLQPALRGLRKRFFRSFRTLQEPYHTVFPYTQVHPVRQANLVRLANEVEIRNVSGVVMECGVLDGGTAALMASCTAQSGREVHLFDSWSGLPETSEKDGKASEVWANDVVGSPKRVLSVMKRLNIDLGRVKFHQGWFEQTFPNARVDQIALLHIDADFYESVRLSLETWGSRVAPGGYIQLDDYAAFIGCRAAVDEFLARNPELQLQTFGQHTQAFFNQIPSSVRTHIGA
jgi:O-methyltransferase